MLCLVSLFCWGVGVVIDGGVDLLCFRDFGLVVGVGYWNLDYLCW